jgi:hypothetical protein
MFAPLLPACSCSGCTDLSQAGRIFPIKRCLRCDEPCANPDCEKPNGGKPVRVKTTRFVFQMNPQWKGAEVCSAR